MTNKEKMRLDLKWATQQRMQYIEIMAFYTGVVSRADVAKAFGLSDAAATKDLKLYSDLSPGNLLYNHSVFGFVPGQDFSPAFADLAPAKVLPVIAANLAVAGGPYGQESIYGLPTLSLPLPSRLPAAQVLAQITRAIHHRRQLRVSYRSLSERDSVDNRLLEPHALVDNGLRWHVRAYSTETYDFRDFVLSRFTEASCLDSPAESSAEFDEDWEESIRLLLAPHAGLPAKQRANLLLDYGVSSDTIELEVRRALIGYVLQRLGVDTTVDHSQNPNAYQLMLINREEIEPFAAWALD